MIIQQTPFPFSAQNIQQRYSDIDILTSKVINVNFSYGYSQRHPKIYGNKYDKKVSIPKSFSKVGFTDTVILFPLIFIRKFSAYYLNNQKKIKKLYVENSFKMANRTTISWVCIFLIERYDTVYRSTQG